MKVKLILITLAIFIVFSVRAGNADNTKKGILLVTSSLGIYFKNHS